MRKETICVDVASDELGVAGSIQPSTAFHYLEGDQQFYPRYFNTPNQESVIQKLCRLERAESGIVFSSGMAAISTTMVALLEPGDRAVLLKGLYGGTNSFINEELLRIGVEVVYVDGTVESFREALNENTRLIYVESPTNPLLSIVDIRGISELARSHGVVTVIDNTFASPILQNPIGLGVDVVVHSGTKYLGGHSDLCCGAVLTNHELGERIKRKALKYGGSLNAQSCYLLERSLKTLALRVQRQSENAMEVAQFLEEHPDVGRVYYPGLADHPGHEVASSQMTGFGAMIAFELDEGIEVARWLRSIEVITPALSLGGVESTVCVPATTSHRNLSAEALAEMGLNDRVIRLSVGIENVEDLKRDLATSITAAKSQATSAG